MGAEAEFQRALLDAAELESVPRSSRERVAIGLGLALPSSASIGTARAASSPSSEAPSSSTAASSTTTSSSRGGAGASAWGKVALLGVAGGLWAGNGTWSSEAHAPLPGVVLEARPSPVGAGPTQARADAGHELATGSLRLERPRPGLTGSMLGPRPEAPLAHAHPTASADPRHPPTSKPPARSAPRRAGSMALPTTPGLLEEVRQLDEVRRQLREHRAAAALSALDAYDRRFATGELALEAAVLKVQALFQADHTAAARTLARRTLASVGSERYRSELARMLTESARANPHRGSIDSSRDMGAARYEHAANKD